MKNLTLLFIAMLLLAGCVVEKQAAESAYLVAVESTQPRYFSVKHVSNTCFVDSVVYRTYGNVITGFNADTLFNYSPFFSIETFNQKLYAEEKEVVRKNGKAKYRRIRNGKN